MEVNFTTYNDADFAQNFVYQTALGAPIDLTGNTLHMMIRTRADDATVFCDLSSSNGDFVILDSPIGGFYVYIAEAVLLKLPVGEYVHSMIREDSYGHRVEMWRGTWVHAAGPTRWEKT